MPQFAFHHGRRGKGSLLAGLLIAVFVLFNYFSSQDMNPITGETQYVAMSPDQEIALGLQAAPQMMQQHGGLHPDARLQARMDEIGQRLIDKTTARQTGWKFAFHLLADPKTVNAFALPGGQIFMTYALFKELQTDAQLAGVLGHEIGHVLARHGAEHLAKQRLSQGLTGAVVVATGDQGAGQMAAMVGQMVNMRYGRNDELESDRLGVRLMAEAGYDPRAMITVMQLLARLGGPNRPPEFFSTHPNPENRLSQIEQAINEQFPDGVPKGLN